MTWAQAFEGQRVDLRRHGRAAGLVSRRVLGLHAALSPQVRGFDAHSMGWLMGTLGISATVGAFLVSGLSDRIGRRRS